MLDRAGAVSFRPATPADDGFLSEVYASTRREELAAVGFPPEVEASFLRQQHETQARSYPLQFPGAEQFVVLEAGVPVGRTWVWRTEAEILLADIALLPEHRGRGTGTAVLRALQREAATRGVVLRLHVSEGDRVAAWYRRLGFATVERHPAYEEMVWRAVAEGV